MDYFATNQLIIKQTLTIDPLLISVIVETLPLEVIVARSWLYVLSGKSPEDVRRREAIEAPFGRCGDYAKPNEYPGCSTPLIGDDWYVCPSYPDCCRP